MVSEEALVVCKNGGGRWGGRGKPRTTGWGMHSCAYGWCMYSCTYGPVAPSHAIEPQGIVIGAPCCICACGTCKKTRMSVASECAVHSSLHTCTREGAEGRATRSGRESKHKSGVVL